MKPRAVAFTPEAVEQLEAIESYIAEKASAEAAWRFTDGIISDCEKLRNSSLCGIRRDDIRPRPADHELQKAGCDRIYG